MITTGRTLEVVGRGAVTIIDGQRRHLQCVPGHPHPPLMVSGARLHVLPDGHQVRPVTSATGPDAQRRSDPEVAEDLRLAEEDLRRLAGDIAAEGVSPTYLRRRRARKKHEGEAVLADRDLDRGEFGDPASDDQTSARRRHPPRGRHRMSETGVQAGGKDVPAEARDPSWRSSRPGSTGEPTSGRTRRRSTSSSTSAAWRTGRRTGCPGSPTVCSICCPGCGTTRALAAARAGSSSGSPRAPGWVTSASTSPCSCSRRSATTCAAARRGRCRASTDRYNVIYGYVDENVGIAAGRLAVRLINHLVEAEPGLRLRAGARVVHRQCGAYGVRAVHPGDHRRGGVA